ncbi:MAG TPA: glycoside hydrolase family 99-like domain-containing protein [Usitatibacter sp.]|nr:glycoside hydrolase family 99-like domain-containing protein [Usitatibacter sp.]
MRTLPPRRLAAFAFALAAFAAHAADPPYVVGALYFGSFAPSARELVQGTERVYGRKDWWGGVRDFHGDAGVKQDSRGWSGDFSNLKPAIGYYDQSSPAVLEQHIRQASDAGLSFFAFYLYWSRAKQGERQPEALRSFLTAPNPSKFRFNLVLYSHPWDDDMVVEGAGYEALAKKLADYFADERYLRLPDGRPVFVIGDSGNLRAPDGSRCNADACSAQAADRLVDAIARAAGARGTKPPFVQVQAGARGWKLMKRSDSVMCAVPPFEVGPSTPYPRLAPSVFADLASLGKPVSPCMLENFDERPRQDIAIAERGTVRRLVGKTDEAFLHNLAAARRFSDEEYARDYDPSERIVYLYAWNEWHEGGILEPNAATGSHDLELVGKAFGLPRGPASTADRKARAR